MTEEQFKEFFREFYQIAYYSNKADYSKMDFDQRRKFEKWLSTELKKLQEKMRRTSCGNTLMEGMTTAIIDYVVRKMDMENHNNGNGIKSK